MSLFRERERERETGRHTFSLNFFYWELETGHWRWLQRWKGWPWMKLHPSQRMTERSFKVSVFQGTTLLTTSRGPSTLCFHYSSGPHWEGESCHCHCEYLVEKHMQSCAMSSTLRRHITGMLSTSVSCGSSNARNVVFFPHFLHS